MPQSPGSSANQALQASSTESTPFQRRGNAAACAARVLRSSSSSAYAPARGTTPSSSPSAHVSHPLIAYQTPPTKTAFPPPIPGPPMRSPTCRIRRGG